MRVEILPATFKRSTNTVLAGVIKCWVNSDDTIVNGENLNDHDARGFRGRLWQ